MAVHQVEQCLARRRNQGPEADACHAGGRNADALAQREDRVQHMPHRVREAPGIGQRHRIAQAARAADELRTVGLDLRRPDGIPLDDGELRGPDSGIVLPPLAPRGEEHPLLGHILRLDEELGEGRMCDVIGRPRQHQLHIGGDLQLPYGGADVGDRDAAHLGVILG